MRVPILLSCLLWPVASAAAQPPDVEGARALAEEGRFSEALVLIERLFAGDDLSRDDVAELLEVRAVIHFATGDEAARRASLAALAALAPGYRMGPERPPELVAELDRLAGPALTVTAAATRAGGLAAVRASVDGDPGGLAREVRVGVRVGQADWIEAVDALEVPAGDELAVRYYALLIGPGGAVVARDGDRGAPRRLGAASSTAVDPDPVGAPARRAGPLRFVGAGAVAAGGAMLAMSIAAAIRIQRYQSDRFDEYRAMFLAGDADVCPEARQGVIPSGEAGLLEAARGACDDLDRLFRLYVTGLVTSLALAGAGTALLVWDGRRSRREVALRLVPAPSRHGAALQASLAF